MEPSVYAVIGHGNEEPVDFNARPRVPPGTTVVLLTTPGQPFSEINARMVWEAMVAQPELFKNPVDNKRAIESLPGMGGINPVKLRIYETGAPMPAMRINPQSYFPSPTYAGNWRNPSRMLIAGIYKLPLPFPTLGTNAITELSTDSVLTESNINQLYSGDANRQIRDRIQSDFGESPRVYQLLNQDLFNYNIEDILQMNGEGVYYFFNCRYVRKLGSKLNDFLGRLGTDIDREREEIRRTMPEPPSTKNYREQHSRWFSYNFIIDRQFRSFKDILKELEQAGSMLPEDKLMWLRNILLEGTFAEGNNLLRGREPVSLNNIQSLVTRMERLEGSEHGLFLSSDTVKYVLAPLKRRYLALYDEEFGELFRRLPVTRQRSSTGQERYAGGKRKTRRSKKKTTRRNRH